MSSIFFIFLLPYEEYFYADNFEKSLRYAELTFQLYPDEEIFYYQGISELLLGRLEESIRHLEKLKKKNKEIKFYLGVAYYQKGDYDRAIKYLKETDNFLFEKYYYLLLIELKMGNLKKARDYLPFIKNGDMKREIEVCINEYEMLDSARKEILSGQFQSAVKLYKMINNFFGYKEIGMAIAYAGLKEYKTALDLLDSILPNLSSNELLFAAIYNAGKLNYLSGNYNLAKIHLRNYLSGRENNSAKFILGKIFSEEGNFDSAALYFKDLPDTVDDYLFYKGRTDYYRGIWGGAEEKLLRHREFFPNSIYADRAIYILGIINFKRGEYQEAIDYWQDLINLYPESKYAGITTKGIADCYYSLKKYNKAIEFYKMVKNFNPSDELKLETQLKIFETRYHLHRYTSLIDALQEFVEIYSDSLFASEFVAATELRIAKIHSENQQYYSALAKIDDLIKNYPNASIVKDALLEKIKICQKIGERNKEKETLSFLMEKKDALEYYPYAVKELGRIYTEEMKYDSALYYYNLLLKKEKNREIALLEIAKIYNTLGQYEAAELMVNQLIAEFPDSKFIFDAYILKSEINRKAGNYKRAVEILKELSEKVGQKPEIFLKIGDIYYETKDYLMARENYLRASEFYKENRDGAAIALLLSGNVSIALGDKKYARDCYLKAVLLAVSPNIKEEATKKLTSLNE